MIKGYGEGADISLLNTIYQYPRKQEDGKYSKDFIILIYKDNTNGNKYHETIYNPDYEFYMANDDVVIDSEQNLFFIEKDKVHKVSVPFNTLEKNIAEMTGNTEFYYNNIKAGNRYANKELHTLNNIFGSDRNIEDHYRSRFSKLYKNDFMTLNKAYFDIEADTISMRGDFPEMGECPINAVSLIDDKTKKISIFLLRNPNNPLIQEFENSINSDLFKELKEFIIANVGGWKQATRFGLMDLEYEFSFYDEEIKLIHDLFITINRNEPDFLLAWNMAFDVPYIIERLKTIGYDPSSIICHPDFEEKIVEYFIDERHKNEYEARGDKYTISSNTVYLDQLIHFASRRKGQAAFPNFKLDTAGEIIAKVKKLDYSHITNSIAELPYKDYKTFVFYNIMDTIVQKCIEMKVSDIDYIYNKCTINNTRYDKGSRQTVYLTNRGEKYFYNKNYIMGNNANRNTPKQSFPGALVGDPTHNSDYAKIKQNGEVLNLADNLDDFDYAALYPNITAEHNMAPNTQIGRVIIENKVHDKENPFNFEFYERGGQFLEDLCSQNIIEFSERWLGFLGYREWLDYLEYYYSNIKRPILNMNFMENGLIVPINYTKTENSYVDAIYYSNELQPAVLYGVDNIDMKGHIATIHKNMYTR